ncbi:MAG: hypothetical protein J7K29_01920, partial [Candidatus Cloacimonetes bacterium]|nr:hypothetical protein [Candidatus Cloacimonadota bacterium]
MKKGIIFLLVLMLTASWAFAEKAAPIQYDPANYPAPTRQGGDTVASALVFGGLPYNDSGTTAGYVNDYDEACPYTGSTAPDVVYSFTPAADVDNVIVSLCGDTDYDTKLYIYENAVTPGAPFACNDDECVSALGQSFVSELTGLTFIGGNTYYIVVDGYGGNSGNYEIDVTGGAAGPENDTCETAEVVGEVTDLPFDTSLATPSGFGTYITSNDLFYVYTASGSGLLYVGLCDSGFDTKLAIYGECDAATLIASNDDSCGAQSELIDVPVMAGEDYYIQIGGYSSSNGAGLLDVAFTLGGDTCDDAVVVGEVTDLPFDTTIATASGFGTYISSNDLFYVYTADSDGLLYIGLCGSSLDTKLALYGECDATTLIASNDDSCGLQSELFDIAVVAGEDYFIQIGGYGSSAGTGVLDVEFTSSYVPEPPVNLFVTEEAYATWEAPSSGGAEALYSQMDFVSSEGGVTSQDFETAYDQYDAEGADDFVVPAGETWTINEVAILGSFSAAGPCTLANVRFFEDAAGMPGTLLFEYLDVPANFDATGNFDCSFDDTILAEGTYWIGVQGRLDFAAGGQWFWTKQAAPTIDAEFYWQNPGDGFGSGFTTWVAGSIQWPQPDYVDFNLSFALFGSLAEDDKVIVKSNNNRIDVSDNVYVTEMDPRILEKGPQLTGAGSSSGALYSREFIGYNLYIDGVFDGFTTELFYQYEGLVDGTTYLAQVTAVYDEGESDPIDYTFTY